MGGYVQTWDEFEFIPGALEALRTLATWAPRIVIVTNQQGVGKGFMSEADLGSIHDRMVKAVTSAGGRIDAVQTCPHLARVKSRGVVSLRLLPGGGGQAVRWSSGRAGSVCSVRMWTSLRMEMSEK
ncbi:hypothetical protein [Microbacterium sp.]|uniref:hypothetical protein n=1 Tax=Microbacterium sp. TaxID=51671 RepID=UPI00345DA071